METKGAGRSPLWLLAAWAVTRAVLLLFVFRVYVFPGPDVTTDVSVIYRGWYEVLRQGTFPLDDVTWQYPPAAVAGRRCRTARVGRRLPARRTRTGRRRTGLGVG
ncbi:hypothetical protein ABT407_15175, partial [Streptomyces eurythermus]